MITFWCFLPQTLEVIIKSKKNIEKTTKRGLGPLGHPGSPLSLLAGFLLVVVDFLKIFQVLGKKNKKFSSIHLVPQRLGTTGFIRWKHVSCTVVPTLRSPTTQRCLDKKFVKRKGGVSGRLENPSTGRTRSVRAVD